MLINEIVNRNTGTIYLTERLLLHANFVLRSPNTAINPMSTNFQIYIEVHRVIVININPAIELTQCF
jgi:hypothetical protein